MFRFREINEVKEVRKPTEEFVDIEKCRISEEVMADLEKIAEEAWNLKTEKEEEPKS